MDSISVILLKYLYFSQIWSVATTKFLKYKSLENFQLYGSCRTCVYVYQFNVRSNFPSLLPLQFLAISLIIFASDSLNHLLLPTQEGLRGALWWLDAVCAASLLAQAGQLAINLLFPEYIKESNKILIAVGNIV